MRERWPRSSALRPICAQSFAGPLSIRAMIGAEDAFRGLKNGSHLDLTAGFL
jgi:hypothetical protein